MYYIANNRGRPIIKAIWGTGVSNVIKLRTLLKKSMVRKFVTEKELTDRMEHDLIIPVQSRTWKDNLEKAHIILLPSNLPTSLPNPM